MLKTVSTQLALASDTLPEVLAKGNTTGGTDLVVSTGDDITLADNSKVIFGAGSDLSIYSDGTTGQVTGNVDVTGTLTTTSAATFGGNVNAGGNLSTNANRTTISAQGAWGGQFDVNVGAVNHAQFGSDNFSSGLSCRVQSADGIIFKINGGTEGARLDASGNLNLSTGNVVLASGSGIDFSATAGTGTSELLDDYEEGVWTPELRFSGATTDIAYATQYGTYTKIGRLITAYGKIVLSSKGSATGNAELYGLPVTLPTGGIGVPALAYVANVGYSGSLNFHAEGTTNRIAMQQVSDAGTVAYLLDGNFANNSDLEISITYMV